MLNFLMVNGGPFGIIMVKFIELTEKLVTNVEGDEYLKRLVNIDEIRIINRTLKGDKCIVVFNAKEHLIFEESYEEVNKKLKRLIRR